MNVRLLIACILIVIHTGYAQAASNDCFVTESPQSLPEKSSAPCSQDRQGNIRITPGTLSAAEDQLNSINRVESQWEYEDVAASQTDQVIGGTGAVGDLVAGVYCSMSAASVGTVSIKDGSGSAFVLFPAQVAATVVSAQALNWVSTSGAWKLTTGTNTTCRVSGRFS